MANFVQRYKIRFFWISATFCNEPGPENTDYEGSSLIARYNQHWSPTCTDGFITANPGPITVDNYRSERIYSYNLWCTEQGVYAPYRNCTRKSIELFHR